MQNVLRGFVLAVALVIGAGSALAGEQKLIVVELYTSQGCSSCPPADAMLGRMAKEDGILGLSLHVDYWDYIGWKDEFASPHHGTRQRAYAKQFKSRYVYTPQMVVHGAFQGVGSKRSEITGFIEEARRLPSVAVSITRDGGKVTAVLPATAVNGDVDIYSVFFDRSHVVAIKRGENSGKNLTYTNVVRDLRRIGTWDGSETRIDVPTHYDGADACAIILQSADTGAIIGAAVLALDGQS